MTKLEILELMKDISCGCSSLEDMMRRIEHLIREEKINEDLSIESRRLFQRYAFLASNPFRTDLDDYEIDNILTRLKELKTVPDFPPVERDRRK